MQKISNETIDALICLQNRKAILPDFLYHYTSIENVKNIFQKKGISLKFTQASHFDDKLEGKSCAVFYSIAIEELLGEGIIDKRERDLLDEIEPAKIGFFFTRNTDGMSFYKSERAITYIGCFTDEEADKAYMEKHYIKNVKHEGVCISFRSYGMEEELRYRKKEGYRVTFATVLYGREVVNYLKEFIKKIKNICGDLESEGFTNLGKGILRNELARLSYSSKIGKYFKERESRIILQLPVNIEPGYSGSSFREVEKGIIVDFSRRVLNSYHFINLDKPLCEATRRYMIDRSYDKYELKSCKSDTITM